MSTSILYHDFGVVGYRYKSTSYQEGSLTFTVEKDPPSLRCPFCHSLQVVTRGTVLRRFRMKWTVFWAADKLAKIESWRTTAAAGRTENSALKTTFFQLFPVMTAAHAKFFLW